MTNEELKKYLLLCEKLKDGVATDLDIVRKEEIEVFIESIELRADYLTKKIFELRYKQGLKWKDVAYAVGGNTADSCRMIAKRYLLKSE